MDLSERIRRKKEFDASLVYGTKKFNLLTKRDEHLAYRKEHDSQWTDSKTGIIHKQYAQSRKCPLCEADEFETLFIKCGFPHVKCNKCSLVYVNPILNKEEYEKIFSAEDSWETVLETEEQIKMQSLEANYSLDIMELYLDSKNKKDISICDIGCGPGTLLIEAKKRGYRVLGIESNKRCHKFLVEKGIHCIGDFFPLKQKINNKFDCIFLFNTLEHLGQPLEILLEIKKLLKLFGLVYISVPCIDALVNRVMHEKGGVFGGHTHLQFFSIKTLSLLLQKIGFEVLDYETIITEIGIIKNYLSFKDPYLGDSADTLDFLTPELIYKNHLARNLNMVARLK